MAKAHRILKRANTVRNIRTVTKTMEMVSTARFRQYSKHAKDLRPYAQRSTDLVADYVAREPAELVTHPLMRVREDLKRDAMLVLTSDRGLCAAYNSGVARTAIRRVLQVRAEGYEVVLHIVGRKGFSALREANMPADRVHRGFRGLPEFGPVAQLANELMDEFTSGAIGGVEVVYMQYVSGAAHKPVVAQILPLGLGKTPEPEPAGQTMESYEFHPDKQGIIDQILPASVRVRLFQCFLDAAVCEQSARMAAMKAATDNADEMIRNLTIEYNRTRQGQITSELAEIMGGSEAMRR